MAKKHGSRRVDRDRLLVNGRIIEACRGDLFKVELYEMAGKPMILAKLKGNIRRFEIRIVLNDLVTVELGLLDPTKGMITRRL